MSSNRSCHGVPDFSLESLSASGRNAEKQNLLTLQSKMKCDPEGYESELTLLYRHFESSLELYQQQATLSLGGNGSGGNSGDQTVSKDLADITMFLSHVTPYYPDQLAEFPKKLSELLRSSARSLPSSLRCHLAQSLILLINKKIVDIRENLALFMDLQTLGDRVLRKLAFSHVIQSIRRMNLKHKNEADNRGLQNILFSMLQDEDESKAKRALIVLCDLHRRKVWFDDRTANAICTACFHPSSRIMVAALSFLLGYEKLEDPDRSDDSSSEDETTPQKNQVVLSREAVYKANNKGTKSSKKKKKAKLQLAMRSMKKQQRRSSEQHTPNYYSPLNHLKDAQGFAEKIFSRIQKNKERKERFEVEMMMLKVISRTVGLHRLVLLNFYPHLQKYVQPHQRDVTEMLAAAVQACHDMVPPDAVEPLFRQVVNQFVHDRSRPEAIAVGLNVVREICLRIPLLMTEDLLQDLVMYRKSHEKAVSTAARSLLMLFREICPSLLLKKDRGRPIDPKTRPKEFGEVNIPSNVPGLELLQDDDDNEDAASTDDEEADGDDSDNDHDIGPEEESNGVDEEESNGVDEEESNGIDGGEESDGVDYDEESVGFDEEEESDGDDDLSDDNDEDEEEADGDTEGEPKSRKRKFDGTVGQLDAADTSLRALKKLAGAKTEHAMSPISDGILGNEDFQRIRDLKTKEEARRALVKHRLLQKGSDAKPATVKIPTSDQLTTKRVDPAQLEVNIKRRVSKAEKLEQIKAGREERDKFGSKTGRKQKKTGGTSNRQKEHKKAMPLGAKRHKVARSRQEKKKKQKLSGKQFRGRKAWK
ncbi:hypothetical protein GIB67_004471 [Kingdonia uniflora]|uniref:Protein SDA1 n=1 Tax=Kingdonia uniflora TaxID=39325 RepID=A0A7J7MRP7_9MAGN|nr:hypothetical protein GIB67_004471 [Kingdonia uniflora]